MSITVIDTHASTTRVVESLKITRDAKVREIQHLKPLLKHIKDTVLRGMIQSRLSNFSNTVSYLNYQIDVIRNDIDNDEKKPMKVKRFNYIPYDEVKFKGQVYV